MGVPEKTLITGEEILEYIPQRPPVVMVDTFYGIDERGCARSGLTVTADNLLVADGVLDECGIVEHIAQSASGNAHSARQVAEATTQMRDLTNELHQSVGRFRV